MKSIKFFPLIAFLLIFSGCLSVETRIKQELLPLDPAVETGVLDNGLTWYVRENNKPEGRASLRLIIRAGSILEDDDQQGIAHLLEHMAFNGTENFEKMELVNYLESIGMAFGPEINAYTSFDETVYMLEIPTDDQEIIDKAFLILEDWAHRLILDGGEIEKERGVVKEEWRLGRGASGRIRDQILPVLLGDSRYSERLPIGKMESVMNTPADRIRDFYREWYRPELMALIVVGDVKPGEIRKIIETNFSGISTVEGRPREEYEVPIHEETLIKAVTDPEVPVASFEFSIKADNPSFRTKEDYREYLVRSIFWGIFNSRLDELSQSQSPPFIGAQGGESQFVATRSFISYNGVVSSGGVETGLERLLTEVQRVSLHGVLSGELEREKEEHLTFIRSAWQDRENRRSPALAQELVSYFLKDVFMPGLEAEYELFQEIIPQITLEEINSYGTRIFPSRGRTLTMTLPESPDTVVPDEAELRELIQRTERFKPEPWQDDFIPGELMTRPYVSGSVLERESFPELGLTMLTLDNGASVFMKKTDFMEDEVLFQAFSSGGLSLLADEDYHEGAYAPLFTRESGLADYSSSELSKILAGHNVNLTPYIGDYFEGLSGQSSPDDLETMLQLVYLTFSSPGFSENSFENVRGRLGPLILNRLTDPQTVYQDRLGELISDGAFRFNPLDEAILASMKRAKMEELFRQRFSDPGDFNYIFLGNLEPEKIEELALTYLSGGRDIDIRENWIDNGIRPPEGIVDETVRMGIEPKGRVTFYFHGEGIFSEEEEGVLPALGAMIQTRLREILREDLSGTYSVRAGLQIRNYPVKGWAASIVFGCDPERADELSLRVLELIESVKEEGIGEDYLVQEIEKYRRAYQVGIKENNFWMNHLVKIIRDSEDYEPVKLPEVFEEELRNLDIREVTGRVFNNDYIRLVLLPDM